jgi:hypothetical protein
VVALLLVAGAVAIGGGDADWSACLTLYARNTPAAITTSTTTTAMTQLPVEPFLRMIFPATAYRYLMGLAEARNVHPAARGKGNFSARELSNAVASTSLRGMRRRFAESPGAAVT